LVKGLLVGKLEDGAASVQGQRGDKRVGRRKLARGTVRHLLGTMNAILGSAVEDGIIAANPLQKLGKRLNLGTRRDLTRPKALDAAQLSAFMAAAREQTPDLYPAFGLMAWAGLRIGEGIALGWDRVDLAGQTLKVDRQLSGTTKTAASVRTVDVADPLRHALVDLQARHRAEAFHRGEPVSAWVLFPSLGEAPDRKDEQRIVKQIRRGMAGVLKVAGLPPWHTPHSLRHTFGSLLVAAGTSLSYVKEQMGHASIQMTVDVYGSWLPKSDVAAVNRVFGGTAPVAVGSKVVAEGVSEAAGRP
jgi:integrase